LETGSKFALLGRGDLEQYAILMVRIRSGCSSLSRGQTNGCRRADETFTKRSLRPKSRSPADDLFRFEYRVRCRILGNGWGFFRALACVALLIDMIVAVLTNTLSTMPKGLSPLNWLDNFLYRPEVLYVLLFIWLICSGSGKFSVDYSFAGKLWM